MEKVTAVDRNNLPSPDFHTPRFEQMNRVQEFKCSLSNNTFSSGLTHIDTHTFTHGCCPLIYNHMPSSLPCAKYRAGVLKLLSVELLRCKIYLKYPLRF